MRQNSAKTQHLSKISDDKNQQKIWLENYKLRELSQQEFYFVIENRQPPNEPLGLVRMYDFLPEKNSFCWGSWLIKDDAPVFTGIESALMIYEFAFYTLHFENVHFDVRKNNSKVIAFHKRFGAKIVSEDEQNYYFTFNKKDYEAIKPKYKKFL